MQKKKFFILISRKLQNTLADSCPDPTPANGYILDLNKKPTNGRYPKYTSLHIACDKGYTSTAGLYGLHLSYCWDGEWDIMFAICVADNQGGYIF